MSNSESETNEPSEDFVSTEKSQLKCMDDVRKLTQEELVDYVERIHEYIAKTNQELAKCRQTIKQLTTKTERPIESKLPADSTKTDQENAKNDGDQENNEDEISASTAFSFVDEMRQTAEQAQSMSEFIYEPTTGLYYDPKSGYFYNPEYGLFYDNKTNCYYSYDKEKKSFEFYCHAQVQDNKNDDDDIEEVEFDEYGGVITDKSMLRQIKRQKVKDRRRKLERKSNSNKKNKKKKKKKKDGKNHKGQHKSNKKQRKHDKRGKRKKDCKSKESESDNENNIVSARKTKRCRMEDVEDGELSQSSRCSSSSTNTSSSSDSNTSSSDSEENEPTVPIFKASGRFQDIAKKYPPSLRIIVQETNVDKLKVGSLHLVTFKGGTLGREGAHDVIISDVNVSKCHLKFHYDHKKSIYKCVDLGSRNGTVLNGMRMSESKAESQPYDLVHGSVIQIGQTKLLCHVHEGNSTCGLCEPGLLIEKQPREASAPSAVALTHKEQLKMLQKKYGLENEKFVDGKTVAGGNYNDRAASRRVKVGSTTDKEKTEVASVNTEISSENKGFKMLSKLGWSKGNALGKTNASGGLLAPINVVSNEGKTGLGCEQPATSVTYTAASKQKMTNLKITQKRYERADIFLDSDDTD